MRAPHGNHLKLEIWDEIRTFFRKHLGLYGVRDLLPCLRWPWTGGNKSQDVTKSKDGGICNHPGFTPNAFGASKAPPGLDLVIL